MSLQIDFYDDKALLKRLVHGYQNREEFIFLFGSGLTCPTSGIGGVLNVEEIVELVRKEFVGDLDDLKELDEQIGKSPADSRYQIVFHYLNGRRPNGSTTRIIRRAVLAARLPSTTHQHQVDLLSTVNYKDAEECEKLCKVLEDDLAHWHMRPGVRCLGNILTEFHESFGGEVITTNFDPLIEVSVRRANGKAWAWSLPDDSLTYWPPKPADGCRVLHIHGYWSGVDTLNTRGALEHERLNLDRGLGEILRKRVLVVMGYGGWDDAFTRAVFYANKDPKVQTEILWAFYPSDEQHIRFRERHLLKRLMEDLGKTRVVFYKGIDADKFFPKLLEKLYHERDSKSHDHSADGPRSEEGTPEALNSPAPPQMAREVVFNLPAVTLPAESLVHDQTLSFVAALRKKSARLFAIDDYLAKQPDVEEPKFLLFERQGARIMAVVSSRSHIAPYRLQKTTEPQVEATPLSQEQVEELGFKAGRVHPMFSNERQAIQRIFWDSSLLTQAILFPESQMALPVYHPDGAEQKILAPIAVILELLEELHGPGKIVFANIADRSGAEDNNAVLQALIAKASFVTRYAPTPSGHLHLGNARTALATYLLSLNGKDKAKFYLRVDNTDDERNRANLIDPIKDDLKWLGLCWDIENVFQQSDKFGNYKKLLGVLELAGLTEEGEDGAIFLKSLPAESYYCLHYDWRLGAIITHQPPLTRERSERKLSLFRANGNAFYRFAGLIDDVRRLSDKKHLTIVIRDIRQAFFTQEQAHIRYALEIARQKLQSHPEAQRLFQEAGIEPKTSIPVPVYLLVPYVTDNGEVAAASNQDQAEPEAKAYKPEYTVLHKRGDEKELLERYMIYDLKQHQRHLPESIISYLVATILPYSRESSGWKKHLSDIALVFSHLGVQAGLQFFSQRFKLDDLVRSQQPLHCNLGDIHFTERVIIRTLPFWKLKQKLIEEVSDLDDELVKRISNHAADFASFAQMLDIAQKPRHKKPLSQITKRLLARADKETRGATQFVNTIRTEMKQIWQDAKTLPPTARKERYEDLSHLLADLRKALTAAETSPKIEQVLTILGDKEVEARLRKNWGNA